MQSGRRAALGVLVTVAYTSSFACGGGEGETPHQSAASYQVLELTIAPPVGETLAPGKELNWALSYIGSLANPPEITGVLTHMETGATFRRRFSAWPQQQSRMFDLKQRWIVLDDFFKKPGTFQIQFEAEVTATLKGSQPWVVQSNPVLMTLKPTLRAVQIMPAGEPIPYGTPLEIVVEGTNIWEDVVITGFDAGGEAIPELPQVTVPFQWGQTSSKLTWRPRARSFEKVGTHQLLVMASFGDVTVKAAPIRLLVTHTIDEVRMLVRDQGGTLGPVGTRNLRLPDVKELVIRATGTQLAGHEVTINGGEPFVAAADEIEIVRTPREADYPDGKGTHKFAYTLGAGGMERTASIELPRWGILSCGWQTPEGRPIATRERVPPGTLVIMHAATWGFPDTNTTLQIFKDRQATFTIWERDEGRKTIELDPANNDDEVDSFDSDIIGDKSTKGWTTEFDEEATVPLIGDTIFADAEMYFDVTIEDQLCSSETMIVPSGVHEMR